MSKSLDAVTIPKWGIEMTQGTIVAWHKDEGDTVKAGEEIVDIETDKIVNSFEARSSGTLVRILAEVCLLYTSPSPRDATLSRMPSSA